MAAVGALFGRSPLLRRDGVTRRQLGRGWRAARSRGPALPPLAAAAAASLSSAPPPQQLAPAALPAGYAAAPHTVGVGAASAVGHSRGSPKSANQDSWRVQGVRLSAAAAPDATLITVCDGHGVAGQEAAELVSERLAADIHLCAQQAVAASGGEGGWCSEGSCDAADPPLQPRTNLASPAALAVPPLGLSPAAAQVALREAFRRVSAAFATAADDFTHSGSTAVACIVLADCVVAAWVGDSRAVYYAPSPRGMLPLPLTEDHKPDKLAEAVRILSAGGWVSQAANGLFRVCMPPATPGALTFGLAVARAFGDSVLAPAGVISEPEFAAVARSGSGGERLVVATDGLWEMLSNKEAGEIAGAAASPEAAAQALVDEARRRWFETYGEGRHCDDCTAVVAFL